MFKNTKVASVSGIKDALFLLHTRPVVLNKRSDGVLVAGVQNKHLATLARTGYRLPLSRHQCKGSVFISKVGSILNRVISQDSGSAGVSDSFELPSKNWRADVLSSALALFAGGGPVSCNSKLGRLGSSPSAR